MEVTRCTNTPSFGKLTPNIIAKESLELLNIEAPNIYKVLNNGLDQFVKHPPKGMKKGQFNINGIELLPNAKALIITVTKPLRSGNYSDTITITSIPNPKGEKYPDINLSSLIGKNPRPEFMKNFQYKITSEFKKCFNYKPRQEEITAEKLAWGRVEFSNTQIPAYVRKEMLQKLMIGPQYQEKNFFRKFAICPNEESAGPLPPIYVRRKVLQQLVPAD